VLQRQAGDALLDTYEAERRHVAIVNSMQSVKNGKKIFQLLKILGLGDDVVTARQNLYASLKDPAKVKLIDEGVEDQREHFDNVWTNSSILPVTRLYWRDLQLELHIGYVYGSNEIPPHASKYTPKFLVGARLPHAWIRPVQPTLPSVDVSYVDEFTPEEIECRQYSTLDLCDFDKFTLIGNLDVPNVKTLRLGRDFTVVGEAGVKWVEGAGLERGGGLLIRPDQHILMVLDPDTTVEDVQDCLQRHLRL
jgi:hypothetical protein